MCYVLFDPFSLFLQPADQSNGVGGCLGPAGREALAATLTEGYANTNTNSMMLEEGYAANSTEGMASLSSSAMTAGQKQPGAYVLWAPGEQTTQAFCVRIRV